MHHRFKLAYKLTCLWTVVIVAQAASAQEPSLASEILCSVTDEQIAMATAKQPVRLDTEKCTANLKMMVDSTLSRVRKSYGPFYEEIHLTPDESSALSLILARRQLLSLSWSAGNVEHYSPVNESAQLEAVELEMQALLTQGQVAALQRYEQTIVVRTLLAPVTDRLDKRGRPLPAPQVDEALKAVQRTLLEWRESTPASTSSDSKQRCSDSTDRMNERDRRISQVLHEFLDAEQIQIAQVYYRNLIDRREASLERYKAAVARDENAICAIPGN